MVNHCIIGKRLLRHNIVADTMLTEIKLRIFIRSTLNYNDGWTETGLTPQLCSQRRNMVSSSFILLVHRYIYIYIFNNWELCTSVQLMLIAVIVSIWEEDILDCSVILFLQTPNQEGRETGKWVKSAC